MRTLHEFPYPIWFGGMNNPHSEFDPHQVFKALFSDFRLEDLRIEVWNMFKSASLDISTYNSAKERSNLNTLFEHVCDALTAAYYIMEKEEETKND